MQEVEKEGRERHVRAQAAGIELAADPAGGDLERLRAAAFAQRDYLPVKHQGARAEGHHRVGDLGDPRSDVIERAREYADLVTLPVNLDPDPVDLPLSGRR